MSNDSAGTGSGSITRDAKIGHLVNAIVTAVGLAVVSWAGDLDFSTAPKIVSTLAPVVVGLGTGWITTYLLPRYSNSRRTSGSL